MSQLALSSIALIAVVEGSGGGAGRATPELIHNAVAFAAAQVTGVRLLSEEEMFVGDVDGARTAVLECGADAACLAAVLRRFGARLGLVALVLESKGAPALIVLRLIDADRKSAIATDSGALSPAEGGLEKALRARTGRLLARAGYAPSLVSVHIAPANVEVIAPPIYTSPWFWAAIAGVVVTAGATAAVVASGSSPRCVCFETGDGVCRGC